MYFKSIASVINLDISVSIDKTDIEIKASSDWDLEAIALGIFYWSMIADHLIDKDALGDFIESSINKGDYDESLTDLINKFSGSLTDNVDSSQLFSDKNASKMLLKSLQASYSYNEWETNQIDAALFDYGFELSSSGSIILSGYDGYARNSINMLYSPLEEILLNGVCKYGIIE